MNAYLKSTTTALSLSLLLSVSACEKDSLLAPVTPDAKSVTAASQMTTQDISPKIAQKYTPIRVGEYALTYYPDGKLKSVRKGNRFATFEYQDAPARIFITLFQDDNNYSGLLRKHYIDLNDDGWAKRSKIITYRQDNMPNKAPEYIDYGYENDRLVSIYDKELVTLKTWELTYNSEGDLTAATQHKNGKVAYTNLYTYGVSGAQLKDYHVHNPQFTFFDEGDDTDRGTELMFLPVFGKFGKHLVQTISRNQNAPYSPFSFIYKYELNSDGRITQRERWQPNKNKPLASDLFEYKVENIGILTQ